MQVVLLKDYKPHTRVIKAGKELGVTNELGLELIEKGIARDITKEYNILVEKKREENNEVLEDISKDNPKPKKDKKNN